MFSLKLFRAECALQHSIDFSKMCEAPQSCVKVIRVIRQILQGCKQKQILSIHLLKIEKKIVVANSKFLWPYNWPLDWPFWCNYFTEGVIFMRNLEMQKNYCWGTHVRTNGTDVFVADMLSSISQSGGDKSMKPMAFYHVFILVLWRFFAKFLNWLEVW